jgi:hypothetical protein
VDAFATPFVQGHLRNERLAVTVQSECAHCRRPMTLDITSELAYQVHGTTSEPIVFVPDVNVAALEAPSIIDDF